MQAKVNDYTKKKTGHHKIHPKSKNYKKGVSPKSINQNTMTPTSGGNRADQDLGQLLSK